MNDELKEKLKLKIAISQMKKEEEKKMKSISESFRNIAAVTILVVGLMIGTVYAGTVIYEKIWKEPKVYTYEEMTNNLPPENVTEEEKKELISEEEAKNIGLDILKKLGYENQTINRVELKRGYSENTPSYYMVKTKREYEEGLMVLLNANGGDFQHFEDMELKYKHLQPDDISDEEITKISEEICNKIGLQKEKYKFDSVGRNESYFQNQKNTLLGANFYKFYDGIKNKYESFTTSFLVVKGKLMLNTVSLSEDNTYQNNPQVITEEQAINIAKDKESQISPLEITNVISRGLSIEKMNSTIYQIENDNNLVLNADSEEQKYYETENETRKVWKIRVEHNISEMDYKDMNKYIKEGMDKIYFVDATTGEIIGGEQGFVEERYNES